VVRMTSQDFPGIAGFEIQQDWPAPAFDETDTPGSLRGCGHRPAMTTLWQLPHDLSHETDGLGDFVESHGNSRSDVSIGAHNLVGCELCVGIPRQVTPQIKTLAAGAPRQSSQSESGGQSRRDHTGPDESIAQARVLVIDRAESFDLRRDRLDAIDQPVCAAG